MQDLSGFSGRKGSGVATLLKCNCGGQYRNIICLVATSIVSLAGIFITLFGAKIGKNVVIRPSVKITYRGN